ncbi:MAG: TRAP transporter small permease subunit [Chloroflexota bacterium]
MKALRTVFSAVDKISTWLGKGVSFLIPVLIIALTYDTFMRYVFREPTVWAYDIAYMVGGTIMLMGMAWVTTRREQVRVDILYTRYSEKTKLAVDAIGNMFLFLPLFAFMVIEHAVPRAIRSFVTGEFSEVGFWRPPLWPYRWMILVALIMWLLAAIVWVVRDLHKLRTGEDL